MDTTPQPVWYVPFVNTWQLFFPDRQELGDRKPKKSNIVSSISTIGTTFTCFGLEFYNSTPVCPKKN